MTLLRRQFLRLAAGAAALPAVTRGALALDYPTRPVRIVVSFAAGNSPDVVARILAEPLSQRFGRPFIVENRPGAGGNIATEAVARAAPDGHTLLMMATPNLINSLLHDDLSVNFTRDIAPVASLVSGVFAMVVNPSFPAANVAEFIAYAKANPGKINMASVGTGSLTHIFGELFKMKAGIEMVHVPYGGEGLAQTDLMSGRAQVMFDALSASIGLIRSGKIRALAVTTAARSELLPEVPPIADTVPGFNERGWQGLGAPRDTPPEIVQLLNSEINQILGDPKIKAHFADLGQATTPSTPAEFGQFIAAEAETWSNVIKFAGIKAE
jgi:tripartite-type tricarboxylate transporter receptor subunit TctC